MHGGHPRAIGALLVVYKTNGPNLTGNIEGFASGVCGLLALKKCKGGVGVFLFKNWTEILLQRDKGGHHRQEKNCQAPF